MCIVAFPGRLLANPIQHDLALATWLQQATRERSTTVQRGQRREPMPDGSDFSSGRTERHTVCDLHWQAEIGRLIEGGELTTGEAGTGATSR